MSAMALAISSERETYLDGLKVHPLLCVPRPHRHGDCAHAIAGVQIRMRLNRIRSLTAADVAFTGALRY